MMSSRVTEPSPDGHGQGAARRRPVRAIQEWAASLGGRVVLVMLALVLVPQLISGVYFYRIFSANLQSQAEDYLESFIATVNQSVADHYTNIDYTSMSILANREIRELLQDNTLLASQRNSRMADLLKYELFFNRAWDSKLIERVFICQSREVFFSTPQSFFNPAETAALVDRLFDFTDGLAADKYLVPPTPDQDSVYFFRNINDINTTQNLGRIFLQVNLSRFVEIDTPIRYRDSILITYDTNGIIITHTNPNQVGRTIDPAFVPQSDKPGVRHVRLEDRDYLATVRYLEEFGLYSTVAVPEEEVFSSLYRIGRTLLQFLAIFSLVCILLALLFAAQLVRPIRSVIQSVVSLQQSRFKERIRRQKIREFNELAEVFNGMASEIDHLVNVAYEKQLLLRESELQNLRSQVNPHFLFNVLETVGWQASISGNETIETMIESLGELLRASQSWSGSDTISVAEELRYIRFYLDLQKIRFADRIRVDIAMDDKTLLGLQIPKLSIMPLVENAFTHGLEPKKGPGSLRIRIWEEEEELRFQIVDDGIGFDTRIIDLESPRSLAPHAPDHASIGIVNSHRRIRMLFGPRYGIRLRSVIGEGTEVMVVLPKMTEGAAG